MNTSKSTNSEMGPVWQNAIQISKWNLRTWWKMKEKLGEQKKCWTPTEICKVSPVDGISIKFANLCRLHLTRLIQLYYEVVSLQVSTVSVVLLHPLTHLRSILRHFSLIPHNRTVARASVLWCDMNLLIIDW